MGQWTRDHVPFPGAAARQTVEELVRRNGLMDGSVADLSLITCPALNVLAKRDHIVPRPAAEPIPRLLGGGADELQLDAGHVGLVAGRAAAKVTLPGIVEWIAAHSEAA
jgi:polyhydroxyalkanoate synthase